MARLIHKTVKGHQYWYIVETKRIDGKVKQCVLEYIGNDQKLSEKILTQTNLNDISFQSYAHGAVYILYKIAKFIDIEQIIDSIFTKRKRKNLKRSTSLLLAAIQRIVNPGSKNSFSEWIAGTTLPYYMNFDAEDISSQLFWSQMDGITDEQILEAEKQIYNKISSIFNININKLSLDYTNFYTYIDSFNSRNTIAKRGKNKQKRFDLRQVSLALVVSKELNIPILAHTYEGNINDQTEFKEYLKILKDNFSNINNDNFILVFDGGSNTKENLDHDKIGVNYICRFSLSSCREFYDIDLSDYNDILINEKNIKFYRKKENLWGFERTCILTYSQHLKDGQVAEFEKNIDKAEIELSKLNEKLIKKEKEKITQEYIDKISEKCKSILNQKFLSNIFSYSIDNNKLIYSLNEEEKNKIIYKYFGKKLVITNKHELTTEEILSSYYEQDYIEKMFKQSKDIHFCNVRPIFHWTDQKIKVHIFICMLSLTLVGVLQKILNNANIRMSNDKILNELNTIREGWVIKQYNDKNFTNIKQNIAKMRSSDVIRKIENMTSTQAKLWAALMGSELSLQK